MTCECYGCVAQDEQRAALKVEMEVAVTKMRKRSLGNICFIGELFKLQILSEAVIHECITRLLKSTSDEESLECFVRLITTTGKYLDKEAAKVGNAERKKADRTNTVLIIGYVFCISIFFLFSIS